MPRPKKVAEQEQEPVEPVVEAKEETIEPIEPIEQEQQEPEQDESSEDSVVKRVVGKLTKTVTIKRQLSEKQQEHLKKLASQKKGKKYLLQATEDDIEELPEVVAPKKTRKLKVVEPIKKRVTQASLPAPQPPKQNVSLFNKSIF